MFTITKTKGRDYKTEHLQTAIAAYQSNKWSLTLWQDGNIVLTRIEYVRLGDLPIWEYLQRKGVKQ